MRLLIGKRKYLLVLAILVLAGFCAYFSYIFQEHELVLLREVAHEKREHVALISGITDRLEAMDSEDGIYRDYESILVYAVGCIEDSTHSVYAQVFDANLVPLAAEGADDLGIDGRGPFDCPEFGRAVSGAASGDLVYEFETAAEGKHDMYVTWRWMPVDARHPSRYLIAVGVSKRSVYGRINNLALYGAAALIVVSAVFIIGSAILLTRLGHIYDMREGDKWRDKGA